MADRTTEEVLREVLGEFLRDATPNLDSIEEVCAEFQRDTGFLAPGKDEAASVNSGVTTEQRRAAWNEWARKKIDTRNARARAALALPSDTTTLRAEVERLTAERDEARKALGDKGDPWAAYANAEARADQLAERIGRMDAELIETRTRLRKAQDRLEIDPSGTDAIDALEQAMQFQRHAISEKEKALAAALATVAERDRELAEVRAALLKLLIASTRDAGGEYTIKAVREARAAVPVVCEHCPDHAHPLDDDETPCRFPRPAPVAPPAVPQTGDKT